jgi:soluble lytic murein transglycosylase
LKKNSEITKPLINTRIDFLLWNGMVGDANLLLPYLSKDRQRLVRARLALLKQDYGVDLLIKNIPANLKSDAGLAYDRFLWRAKKGRSNDAIDILKQQSLSGSNLKYPNKWSRKRRDYVRQAMRDNQPELAYFLASNHFLTSGSDYADLEWLAGYISLRKLKKPAQAIAHLNNFLNAVKTPISLGRAGYWLGRAYETSDNKQLADYYYRLGAQYQISFYGQLSAERIGAKFDRSLVLEEANPVTSLKFFESSDIFRIALLLYHSGEVILAKRFFLHFAIYLNANDHRQLATYLLNIESDFLALSLAKQAASYGKVYSEAYFPLHKLANSNWKIDGDILLAVARRESEFNPKARSSAGARGLMQIMPATAKQLTSNLGYKYSLDRLGSDWQYNLELGAEYLDHLLQRYDGSLLLSFGAYNAGPTRMDKWIKRYGDPRNNNTNFVDWIEHIPFNETRNYIMRVLEGVLVYRAKLYYEKNLPVEIRLTNFD